MAQAGMGGACISRGPPRVRGTTRSAPYLSWGWGAFASRRNRPPAMSTISSRTGDIVLLNSSAISPPIAVLSIATSVVRGDPGSQDDVASTRHVPSALATPSSSCIIEHSTRTHLSPLSSRERSPRATCAISMHDARAWARAALRRRHRPSCCAPVPVVRRGGTPEKISSVSQRMFFPSRDKLVEAIRPAMLGTRCQHAIYQRLLSLLPWQGSSTCQVVTGAATACANASCISQPQGRDFDPAVGARLDIARRSLPPFRLTQPHKKKKKADFGHPRNLLGAFGR